MIKTLNEYFQEAKAGRWAIGHFNFSTADQLRAIVEAAAELKVPVMAATSEGEADFVGRDQAVALVRSYQKEGHDVFLNADHHKSWETTKAAIDAGYDSVLIDASKLPYEENIALTKKVVDYAREVAKSSGREIPVEGELGYLKGSSEVQKKVEISREDYTKPEEAKNFVARTGVDRLALVFGNIHGVVTEQEEHLDIETLKNITAVVPGMTLILHGASGLKDEEIKEAIKNGISNIHINTELRVAYHEALEGELEKEPGQTTPYKFLEPSYEATKKIVLEKLKLFKNP
ncbi:MAG: class II fructose-bisphosphate aldolase [Patescibacteria group bacterium]